MSGRAIQRKSADTGKYHRATPPETPSYDVLQSPQRGDIGRRLRSDEIVIGLALGSPGHNPLPSLPPDDYDVDVPNGFSLPRYPSSQLGTVSDAGSEAPAVTRKGSKWKNLGSLFGKNSSQRTPQPRPFYQLDQTPGKAPANPPVIQDDVDLSALRRKRADSPCTVETKRGRANTLQSIVKSEVDSLLRRNSSRRKGLRRRTDPADLMPDMRVLHSALSAHAEAEASQLPVAPLRPPGPSLLELQIPNAEMERYSVMFGDVLNPPPQQRSPHSLLSRRQVHLEELGRLPPPKTESLTDELPNPHRRDDSTSSRSSGRSPSFSLFPSTSPSLTRNAANKPPSKPSPLSRSVTGPDTTLSPPTPAMQASKSQAQEHVFVIMHSPEEPSTHIQNPSCDHKSTSPKSTQADLVGWPDHVENPKAERGPAQHIAQLSRGTSPVRKSSLKKLPLAEVPRNHQANDPMSTNAEISIARQISISRRQRQLLVPIVPKIAQQPVQPRVVDAQTGSTSRKSHHRTLEDA